MYIYLVYTQYIYIYLWQIYSGTPDRAWFIMWWSNYQCEWLYWNLYTLVRILVKECEPFSNCWLAKQLKCIHWNTVQYINIYIYILTILWVAVCSWFGNNERTRSRSLAAQYAPSLVDRWPPPILLNSK